jgi:hypothetical protein
MTENLVCVLKYIDVLNCGGAAASLDCLLNRFCRAKVPGTRARRENKNAPQHFALLRAVVQN